MSKTLKLFLYLLPVLAIACFVLPSSASAANRYWVGGAGNWSDTAHWSTTSGGSGGAAVPAATDDVFLDANSTSTVTVNTSATTNNLDFTGFTGTFAGSSALAISGNLALDAGMTRSYTGAITFNATSGIKTITSNTKALASAITFDGVGGTWRIEDAFNDGSSAITLTNGTLNTNNQTVTSGTFSSSNSNTRALTLGSTAWALSSSWTLTTSTGMTLSAGTSALTVAGATFAGGGLTYYDISLTGAAATITGANTFHSLTRTGTAAKTNTFTLSADQIVSATSTVTGNSTINRMLVQSDTVGTARTLTAATVSLSNADFMDITGAGAATWTGTSMGDAGGNSNITFTTAVTRYAVAAGNWSSTATWSDSSGGAGGSSVPLPQDDVVLDASSTAGTYTADMPRMGKNIDATNFAQTLSLTSTANTIYGSITLGLAMTHTQSVTLTLGGRSSFTITSNTKSFGSITLDAPGGTYTVQDALSMPSKTLTITHGSFNTNGQTVSLESFSSNNSNTRALTLGASTFNLSINGTWDITTATGMTLSAGSSTITMSGVGTFAGGGFTYNNFTFTGTASKTNTLFLVSNFTFTGTFTVSGNSAINRTLVRSTTLVGQTVPGTTTTLTAAAVSLSNADFMDITGAGAATWSGTSVGDANGNSGITFTTPVTRYAVVAGNWSATSTWSDSSGGAGGSSVPLPQDDVVLDASSAAGTYTADMPRLGKGLTATNFTRTLSFASTANSIYGSVALGSGGTFSGTSGLTLAGRGTFTITSNTMTFPQAVTLSAPGGTYTLQDNFTCTATLTVSDGTFNAGNKDLSMAALTSSSGRTRVIVMGSGTWTLPNAGAVLNISSTTGLTITPNASTIKLTNVSASTKTIAAGGMTYNNIWLAAGTGTGQYSVTGSNTFNDFKDDGTVAHTIKFTAGTTQTVTTFTVSGTSGNLITLNSATAGTSFTLTKAGGGTISSDYLSIQDSTATPGSTWYAGTHSTDVSNNSGWTFTDAPVSNTAPTATISTPAQVSGSTNVSFTATVSDPDLNATSLGVQYSTDNSTWASTTLGSVTATVGTVATSTGQISSIDTNTSTTTLTITWLAATDLPNTEDSTVYLRIIPSDGTVNGSTATSSAFSLDSLSPSTPANFSAQNLTNSSVRLIWEAVSAANSYNLYQTDSADGTFTRIGSNPTVSSSSTTSYDVTGLTPNVKYYWKISAVDAAGNESSLSNANFLIVGQPGGSSGGNTGSSGGGGASAPAAPVASAPVPTASPAQQLTALQNILASLLAQLAPSPSAYTPTPSFSRPLFVSSVGSDVRSLQQLLNQKGFIVSQSGPGSPGQETAKFGALTRAALIRFQIANGIIKSAKDPGAGILGPKTRARLNQR